MGDADGGRMSGAARKIELGLLTERSSQQALFGYACELEGMVKTLSEPTSDEKITNLQRAFRLTGQEAKLLATLADGRVHDKGNLLNALYWDRIDDSPEIKIVDVFVCKIRRKIAGSGVVIETSWGTGYSVRDVEPLTAVMAGEMPAVDEESVRPAIGRPSEGISARKGHVRDAALAFLRGKRNAHGQIILTSRELSHEIGVYGSGSVTIRNLERGGHIEIVKAPGRRGGRAVPGNWVLRLADAA